VTVGTGGIMANMPQLKLYFFILHFLYFLYTFADILLFGHVQPSDTCATYFLSFHTINTINKLRHIILLVGY
jgi:hypothetical protein